MKTKQYKFLISGGGTGGHIFPALAIANYLKKEYPLSDFLFVGAKNRMEMEKIPAAGYKIVGLNISGIQRKLTYKNLIFPFKLLGSLIKAYKILKTYQPDVVIGTGGYASGAVLKVATWMKIPTLIQEQNSYPGITNRLLSKSVDKVCVSFEGLEKFFNHKKITVTGNPIREELIHLKGQKESSIKTFNLNPNKFTILILGGSLGASNMNKLIESNLTFFKEKNVQLIWQCGKLYYDQYQRHNNNEVKVFAFLKNMNHAYLSADLIISRAGAGSISELCLVGKPVIFIPSPNVAEDHQTKNAWQIVEKGGAKLLRESVMFSEFQKEFTTLLEDPSWRKELGQNIKKMAKPNATKNIVEQIKSLIQK